jgi:hypothetical protein
MPPPAFASKFCCIRSMPTAMQSISENDFECFARTEVKTPVRCFKIRPQQVLDFPEADSLPLGFVMVGFL